MRMLGVVLFFSLGHEFWRFYFVPFLAGGGRDLL